MHCTASASVASHRVTTRLHQTLVYILKQQRYGFPATILKWHAWRDESNLPRKGDEEKLGPANRPFFSD